jgi:hypothetical protein
MTTYRSKIGLELVIPLGVVLGGMAALFIAEKAWFGIVIVGSVLLFIGHMFATTRYTVNGTSLQIVCGLFYSTTIDIRSIVAVRSTNNIASSPAASLDRMEILCGNNKGVIISPKDKKGFLNHLRRINPGIDIAVKDPD